MGFRFFFSRAGELGEFRGSAGANFARPDFALFSLEFRERLHGLRVGWEVGFDADSFSSVGFGACSRGIVAGYAGRWGIKLIVARWFLSRLWT